MPRTKLPQILRVITRIGAQVRSPHLQRLPRRRRQHSPDPAVRRTRRRTRCSACLEASHEILDECIRVGGSVTGEHGIGVEKIDFMPKLFTPEDLGMMVRLAVGVQPEQPLQPGQDAADGRGVHRAEQGGTAGGVVMRIPKISGP